MLGGDGGPVTLRSALHCSRNRASSQRAAFVLPKSQYRPPFSTQLTVRIAISSHVSFDLLAPPCCVRFGPSPMSWTPMPETTVDEDCNFRGYENEICSAASTGERPIHAESQPHRMNGRTNGEFARRVAAQGDLHAPPGLGTRRFRFRRRAAARPSGSRIHRPTETRQRCA
jgi:hypothetical protein